MKKAAKGRRAEDLTILVVRAAMAHAVAISHRTLPELAADLGWSLRRLRRVLYKGAPTTREIARVCDVCECHVRVSLETAAPTEDT